MSAPNATTTVNTLGIQGPPGPPALSTTLSGTFVVPAVGSSGIATLTSASGAVVGSWVTIVGGGTFLVTAVGVSQLTLQNNGANGNASAGTFCNPPAAVVTSGPQGPGGAAGSAGTNGTNGTNGADAFSSTSAGFTQPSAGNTVTVTVGHTSGFAAGQVVYVTAGGYYTLTSITDATHLVLTNLGYTGNAGSGALVASGSTVTAGGLAGPAGSSGFTAGGDLSGTTTSQQVVSVTGASGTGLLPFPATATGPGLSQPSTSGATGAIFSVTAQNSSAAGGTGGSLNLSAGNGTGATSTGGAVNLSSGNGTTLGNINFQSGNGAYTLTTMSGQTGAWTWGATALASLGYTNTTGTLGNNASLSGQTSTGATSTGGKILLTPGQGTTKGGDAEVHLYTPTAGTEPAFAVFRNLSGTDTKIFSVQHWPNGLANGNAIYMGAAAVSPSTTNFAILEYAGALEFNAQTGATMQFQIGNVTAMAINSASSIVLSAPVTGDGVSSPYGVHGDTTIAVGTGASVTITQYANAFFSISSTSAATLNGWPRAAAGQGYSKAFSNTTGFPITISDGTHSTIVPANSNHLVWFTNAALALI